MPDASLIGALTSEQSGVAKIMLGAVLDACKNDDLALLQEGYVKGVVAKACIDAGYELREGAHATKSDWLVKRDGTALVTRKVERLPRTGDAGSRDLRVQDPKFHVELKCFGEFGSKDYLDRGGFRKDLERVRGKHADAFLCAVAGKLYDDARGDKVNNQGRKTLEDNTLTFLPKRTSLPLSDFTSYEVCDGAFVLRAGRVNTPGGEYGTNGTGDRVVLLVTRSSAVGATT